MFLISGAKVVFNRYGFVRWVRALGVGLLMVQPLAWGGAPLGRGLYVYTEPGLSALDAVPVQGVDVLLVAFLRLCGDRALPKDAERCRGKRAHELTEGPLERALNHRLQGRKQNQPGLQVLMSIGGWGGSDGFFAMAETSKSRGVLIDAVQRFLVTHPAFDGVDIDWEHPGGNGAANGVALGSARDGEHYAALLAELRQALDALGQEQGRRYRLSIAINATRPILNRLHWPTVAPLLDQVFIMSYDYHGAWDARTGHHAALLGAGQDDSLEESVQTLRAAGVPAPKLWAGAAFYGRAWRGVTRPEVGAAATGAGLNADGAIGWRDWGARLREPGWRQGWDAARGAAWAWHPQRQLWVSFESPQTLRAKATWARAQGLGGVFAWEAQQDNGELLRAMSAP
ncbi:glycoside hydrolase family 18 protein [Inhella gelatinilytica]|uniref:chitinase n=1 Tax=Inhella gelatinilytica TaxID=2795030 RepID=A0A931IW90_9BURK|nr:glycosyl hydrolase family 18 protein [Inhella gelatinilytica]MBH9552179.1 hypothetical protein [Inhella gelatinilytica]